MPCEIEVIDETSVIEITSPAVLQSFDNAGAIEIIPDTSTIEILYSNPAVAIEVIQQGPPGVDGEDGGSIDTTSGESLSSNRLVYVEKSDGKVYYADNTNTDHLHSVLGITQTAVGAEESVNVLYFGLKTNTGWAWNMTIDTSLYLSTNGLLTQTPPTTGFLMPVGFATTATTAFIRLDTPTIRS